MPKPSQTKISFQLIVGTFGLVLLFAFQSCSGDVSLYEPRAEEHTDLVLLTNSSKVSTLFFSNQFDSAN